jgi:hypothetical protein
MMNNQCNSDNQSTRNTSNNVENAIHGSATPPPAAVSWFMVRAISPLAQERVASGTLIVNRVVISLQMPILGLSPQIPRPFRFGELVPNGATPYVPAAIPGEQPRPLPPYATFRAVGQESTPLQQQPAPVIVALMQPPAAVVAVAFPRRSRRIARLPPEFSGL